MADGWACDECGVFYLDVHAVTKITVSIEPRDYAAETTLCSLACLDAQRASLDDDEVLAAEHRTSPKRLTRIVEDG